MSPSCGYGVLFPDDSTVLKHFYGSLIPLEFRDYPKILWSYLQYNVPRGYGDVQSHSN